MSTEAQVNADFFMYCCYYIYSVNGDPKVFDDNNTTFSLVDNGNGIEIETWDVKDVKQPTMTDLKNITPAQIVTGKNWKELNKMEKQMPKLMTIFRDVYNRIGVVIPIGLPVYQNDRALENYLITKI